VSVKGHHRSRTARRFGDFRAELFADRRHFDAVFTAIDGFFVALDCHGGVSILAA
jgi:hypothetical protein